MDRTRFAVLLLLAVVAVGCAGSKQGVSTHGATLEVPDWYRNPPADENHLVGAASATSRDLQTAVDKAKQDGRAEIARQLDVRVAGMSKRFVEETGLYDDAELLDMFTQVSRSIVSDSLTGSRVTRQELDREGGIYRAYVLMEMPIGEANARLVEKIRSHERLYTRFRASEAFDELDRMVEEYEAWKKEQAGP